MILQFSCNRCHTHIDEDCDLSLVFEPVVECCFCGNPMATITPLIPEYPEFWSEVLTHDESSDSTIIDIVSTHPLIIEQDE